MRRWLKQHAQSEQRERHGQVAKEGGFNYERVQIRRQRTRWGSCSATGTISLNLCLVFLSPAVVRYLLVHELCHTRHMNHSARYWALVERHEPDYKRLDKELVRGWQSVPGWVFG
jgi:predicted metal-dependent hydrolase